MRGLLVVTLLGLATLCLILGGCDDKVTTGIGPTPTPTPDPCRYTASVEPSRVAGAYFVTVNPPGPIDVYVGVAHYGGPALGVVVYANRGDVLTICKAGCNCLPPVLAP